MTNKPTNNKDASVYAILHNIRSAHNVGSIFRTADGAGVSKVYLCGYTPTPISNKVSKTALGAEKYLPWEHISQTLKLLEKLKKDGVQIIALEQSQKSFDYRKMKIRPPLALLVGNEITGLNKKILSRSDKIMAIPMRGRKESLNVSVAFGVAIYKLLENLRK